MSTAPPEFISGNRLSPLPEDRTNTVRCDTRPDLAQIQSWEKENIRNLRKMLLDPVVLNDYSFADHHARVQASGPPKKTDASWRGGTRLKIPRERSAIVCDRDGAIGLVVIRGFLKGSSLTNVDVSVDALMPHEFKKRHPHTAPTPPSSTTPQYDTVSAATSAAAAAIASAAGTSIPVEDSVDPDETPVGALTVAAHKRHGDDWYLQTSGHPWGDWHWMLAWHARGHLWSDTFCPSRELLRHSSTVELVRRYLFIDSFFSVHQRVNHLLYTVHPAFSKLLRSARPHFSDYPVINTILPIWHSDFPGQATLMNKRSGEHLDKSGVPHGCDVIIATGDFRRGHLYLKDMNVVLSLEPGDLVMFDGTVQRHQILSFDGPQRVSHVFFVHQSVLTELGINTQMLQDPTLDGLRQQIKVYPAERRARLEAARRAREAATHSTRSRRGGKNNKRPT